MLTGNSCRECVPQRILALIEAHQTWLVCEAQDSPLDEEVGDSIVIKTSKK